MYTSSAGLSTVYGSPQHTLRLFKAARLVSRHSHKTLFTYRILIRYTVPSDAGGRVATTTPALGCHSARREDSPASSASGVAYHEKGRPSPGCLRQPRSGGKGGSPKARTRRPKAERAAKASHLQVRQTATKVSFPVYIQFSEFKSANRQIADTLQLDAASSHRFCDGSKASSSGGACVAQF